MFSYISIKEFADGVMKTNKGQHKRADLIKVLEETLEAKKKGAKCMICGRLFGRLVVQSQEPICVLPAPRVKRTTAMIMKSNNTKPEVGANPYFRFCYV